MSGLTIPPLVVISGRLAAAGDILMKPLAESFERFTLIKHTAKMLVYPVAGGSIARMHQGSHFLCRDDATWKHIQKLHALATSVQQDWANLVELNRLTHLNRSSGKG